MGRMITLFEISKPILDKLQVFFGFPGLDPDERLKRVLMISGVSLVVPVLLLFGLSHLFRGDSFLGWFLVIGGVLFPIFILSFHDSQNIDTPVRVCLAFAGCLFIYLLAVSGPHGHMAMWLYIYPPAVFFIFGLQEGFFFSALFLFASLFVLLFQGSLLNLIPLDPRFSLRFFISLSLVVFIAFFYELVRNRYLKEVKKNRSRVEEEKQNIAGAKKAAEEANRAKSDFLANMSHELRTPLNHILGFTELVVDKQAGDLNREQQEYLEDVLGSGRHLLSLINDILDLSKVEAGKLELEVSEVNLRGLLESSLTMVKEKALKHGIRLSQKIDGVPDWIGADQRKLKQILYNLLANAVKFTPEGGTVVLAARSLSYRQDGWVAGNGQGVEIPSQLPEESRWVEVSVRDTGIGLKKENLERIFSPFEQADNTAGRRYQGTGLGLSLTRRLVELHGGKCWAESEGEGKGSKFNFVIPFDPSWRKEAENGKR